jgi:hypothetical protein
MSFNLAHSPDSRSGLEIEGNRDALKEVSLMDNSLENSALLDKLSVEEVEGFLQKNMTGYTDRMVLTSIRSNLLRIKSNISGARFDQYKVMSADKKAALFGAIEDKLSKLNTIISGEAANDEPYEGNLDSVSGGVDVSELSPEDAARFFPDTISGAQTESAEVDIDLSKPTPKPTTPVDLEI